MINNVKMENEEIRNKLRRFIEAKIPIHVILKLKKENSTPRFFNGLVIGEKPGDIFMLEDRKIGKTYIFLEDIHDLRVFQKDNKTILDERRANFKKENKSFIGEGVLDDEIDIKYNSLDE